MLRGIQLEGVAAAVGAAGLRRASGCALAGLAAWAWGAMSMVGAAPVPDFSVSDVNPNSVRGGQEVSPRDYLLQVSVYYFGAAG